MKRRKIAALAFVICATLVLLSSCGWITLSDPTETTNTPDPPASSPADAQASTQSTQQTEALPAPESPNESTPAEKAEIQAAVETLVDNSYKGDSYSCDILTSADGSGYIVSLQIDVPCTPPDSSSIVKELEKSIRDLNEMGISAVEILAINDFQIVDGNTGNYPASNQNTE